MNLKKIREKRKEKNLTCFEMAHKMGFRSTTSYWHLEKGEREWKVWQLEKVAKILEIPITELLIEENE